MVERFWNYLSIAMNGHADSLTGAIWRNNKAWLLWVTPSTRVHIALCFRYCTSVCAGIWSPGGIRVLVLEATPQWPTRQNYKKQGTTDLFKNNLRAECSLFAKLTNSYLVLGENCSSLLKEKIKEQNHDNNKTPYHRHQQHLLSINQSSISQSNPPNQEELKAKCKPGFYNNEELRQHRCLW